MKNNISKRLLSVLLATIMTTTLSGCSGTQSTVAKSGKMELMPIEEVDTFGLDFIGGKDVMPLSGYYGPSLDDYSMDGQNFPDYFTDEIMSLIAESGVNFISFSTPNYAVSPDYVYKLLELGERNNLGIQVVDNLFYQVTPGNVPSVEEMAQRLTAYADYPAFCGVYVVDEPGSIHYKPTPNQTRDISTYAPLMQGLRELDIVGATNMFPLWNESETEGYCKMIEEFCSTCTPYYLSFDFYVWDGGHTKKDYFYNMNIIRRYAEKYNIPFWSSIQAGGQWNDGFNKFDSSTYFPTEGQLLWNVNTSLAYGAKGLCYFPLIQPRHFAFAESTDFDFQRNGILGAWGNKTQWFYYAQKANAQIAAVDEVLMNSVHKGNIVSGKDAKEDFETFEYTMSSDSWRELKSVQGNTMIGCFNYQGKTALYVVNYEEAFAQKITLDLQDFYNVSITQNAEVSKINTNEIVLDFQPGEGALIVFD